MNTTILQVFVKMQQVTIIFSVNESLFEAIPFGIMFSSNCTDNLTFAYSNPVVLTIIIINDTGSRKFGICGYHVQLMESDLQQIGYPITGYFVIPSECYNNFIRVSVISYARCYKLYNIACMINHFCTTGSQQSSIHTIALAVVVSSLAAYTFGALSVIVFYKVYKVCRKKMHTFEIKSTQEETTSTGTNAENVTLEKNVAYGEIKAT